jgi:hypothetical protein
MNAHMTESHRYLIKVYHIEGLFQVGFVGSGKWFRWACQVRGAVFQEAAN